MSDTPITVNELTDPDQLARVRRMHEQAQRNSRWLAAHWPEIRPRARGRFVAVAGEEVFIADTGQAARALAHAAHPDDSGLLVQYVRTEDGPRIYTEQATCAS